jgi:hypothetical protein
VHLIDHFLGAVDNFVGAVNEDVALDKETDGPVKLGLEALEERTSGRVLVQLVNFEHVFHFA